MYVAEHNKSILYPDSLVSNWANWAKLDMSTEEYGYKYIQSRNIPVNG